MELGDSFAQNPIQGRIGHGEVWWYIMLHIAEQCRHIGPTTFFESAGEKLRLLKHLTRDEFLFAGSHERSPAHT